MINGDWLTGYRDRTGIENVLIRIDYRIRQRMGDRIKIVDAMQILDREYNVLDRDFNSFFPELQQYINGWRKVRVPLSSWAEQAKPNKL
jgi:acyl carrier protein phosphodiesterase